MAIGGIITMLKEPAGNYPAYNDSYIIFEYEFESEYAEILAYPLSLFPKPFLIYPDIDGVYRFNLKEIAKAVLNIGGFKDDNADNVDYFFSHEGLSENIQIDLAVYSISGGDGSDTKYYNFFKSVKQITEDIFTNDYQILSKSKNGIDYNITYFEGFPFSFDIQKAELAKEIVIKNKNTGDQLEATPTITDAFKIVIDKVNENWTNQNMLPLITGLNKLEIFKETEFRTNLNLTKKEICKGVYLKWFNSDGGYSYYLFEEFYKDQTKSKDIDFIDSNEFSNVGEYKAKTISIGRKASKILKIKANASGQENDIIESLFSSPHIEMYTSNEAYVKGIFVKVTISGTFNRNNKRRNNKQSLDIILPEIITAKY